MPVVEWWDEFLLPPIKEGSESDDFSEIKGFPTSNIQNSDIYMDRITSYVQHPVPQTNQKIDQINQIVMPTYLTDKEKKRLSRNKRVAKEKDK